MSEIKEAYVSFETAKLLKDKGFDWEGSPFYSEQDKDEWNQNNNYNIPNPNYDATIPFDSETLNVVVPHVSIQMAMKWLREVHNLVIIIDYDLYEMSFSKDKVGYGYSIQQTINPAEFFKIGEYIYDYYEEACEAAIKHCLENLI